MYGRPLTYLGTWVNIHSRKPVIGHEGGGLLAPTFSRAVNRSVDCTGKCTCTELDHDRVARYDLFALSLSLSLGRVLDTPGYTMVVYVWHHTMYMLPKITKTCHLCWFGACIPKSKCPLPRHVMRLLPLLSSQEFEKVDRVRPLFHQLLSLSLDHCSRSRCVPEMGFYPGSRSKLGPLQAGVNSMRRQGILTRYSFYLPTEFILLTKIFCLKVVSSPLSNGPNRHPRACKHFA